MDELETVLDNVIGWARALTDQDRQTVPEPPVPPEQFAELFDLSLARSGLPRDEVVGILSALVGATPQTAGSRFYNQLFGGRDPLATAADMLATLLNVSLYTHKVAGPMAALEQELVDHACRAVGYPEGDGTLCAGSSLSTLSALVIARNHAFPEAREHGMGHGRGTFYASAEAHYSVRKSAGVLGIGRQNVRAIATDASGGMDTQALAAAIDADQRDGWRPIAVVATSGTTVLGAFDRIDAIAAVTQPRGIWLHVDAALGAPFLLHPEHRVLLRGAEVSDSFTWGAHKLMGVPLTCSMVLVHERGLLERHLGERADYLYQSAGSLVEPGTRSLQCGRRNDALKLWAVWKAYGDTGWAARLDRLLGLVRYACQRIERTPALRLLRQPVSTNVCFEVAGVSSVAVCRELAATGRAMVSYGEIDGREAIRLAVVDPETRPGDLDRFFEDVAGVARSIAGRSPSGQTPRLEQVGPKKR